MQFLSAVILAAGKGTRLEPLTTTTPKPLIKVAGKPIIVHNMDILCEYVSEFVLVVGYMAGEVRSVIGESYRGIPVKYVVQEQQLGTADALKCAQTAISNDLFLVLNGDDIYAPGIYQPLIAVPRSIAGKVTDDWSHFGVLRLHDDGTLSDIVEKPKEFIGNLVNIGVYFFDSHIFEFFDNLTLSIRGEYDLPDVVSRYAQRYPVTVVSTEDYWLTIGFPWHILHANDMLMPSLQGDIQGTVEDHVVVRGNVVIGEGTIVKSGTYIDGNVIIGKNCVIGPHSYIRGNVVIGDMCTIGSSVEIEHSSIGNKVNIEHLSFIGYSVLGNDIIIGGGTITADRRHDREPIRVNIKEQLVESHKQYLGAIIGDQVRTGINTSIYPGRKLHFHSYTVPGEVVKQDKLSSHDVDIK